LWTGRGKMLSWPASGHVSINLEPRGLSFALTNKSAGAARMAARKTPAKKAGKKAARKTPAKKAGKKAARKTPAKTAGKKAARKTAKKAGKKAGKKVAAKKRSKRRKGGVKKVALGTMRPALIEV
jgi:hypothetical protein